MEGSGLWRASIRRICWSKFSPTLSLTDPSRAICWQSSHTPWQRQREMCSFASTLDTTHHLPATQPRPREEDTLSRLINPRKDPTSVGMHAREYFAVRKCIVFVLEHLPPGSGQTNELPQAPIHIEQEWETLKKVLPSQQDPPRGPVPIAVSNRYGVLEDYMELERDPTESSMSH